MKRWWIMAFIIPLPFLLAGILSLTSEPFNKGGIDNLTISIIMFIGYGLGVFIALANYVRGGMILEEFNGK